MGARSRVAFLDHVTLTGTTVTDVDSGDALKTTSRTGRHVRNVGDAHHEAIAERATAGHRHLDRARLHRPRRSTGLGTGAADAAQHDPAAGGLRGDDDLGAGDRQRAGRRSGRDSGLRRPPRRWRHDPDPRHEAEVTTGVRRWAFGVRRLELARLRLQASGFRLQASGFRLQASGFRTLDSGASARPARQWALAARFSVLHFAFCASRSALRVLGVRVRRLLPHHLHDDLALAAAGVELEQHDLLPGAEDQRCRRRTGTVSDGPRSAARTWLEPLSSPQRR